MRRLIWFLIALPLGAQGLDSIQPARLKADLTFLSSDALEGRLSLQRGDEVAVQWIASEFAKAGLKPLVGDSYLQPVPLIEYQVDRQKTQLTVTARGANIHSYFAPDVTCNFPHEGPFDGPVVFAGYGISAPELGYDDYAGLEVSGKVVLIFNHEPQENDAKSIFNGTGNTRYANNYYKTLNAQRHGAVAVLTMTEPSHAASGGRGGRGPQMTAASARIVPEGLAEGGATIPLVTISAAVADGLLAAAGKKAADMQKAIDAKPSPMSFELPNAMVRLTNLVTESKRANSYNVVGLLEGSDPTLKAETIVYSGHHDHNGVGPAGVMHGADDNGSGTVAVVELAHAFGRTPLKPKRSILFIVFAAEERGLLGAYYYVANPLRPLDTTRAQINFDMIGRNETATPKAPAVPEISADTTNELGLIGTHYSPDYRKVVEQANEQVGLKLTYKWDRDAATSVLFRSDQYPFLQHDVPAVWWFTGFHPDYHEVTDTVEKINFEKMSKILRLAYLAGMAFADGAETPKLQGRAMHN
jgi:hypothetical protein